MTTPGLTSLAMGAGGMLAAGGSAAIMTPVMLATAFPYGFEYQKGTAYGYAQGQLEMAEKIGQAMAMRDLQYAKFTEQYASDMMGFQIASAQRESQLAMYTNMMSLARREAIIPYQKSVELKERQAQLEVQEETLPQYLAYDLRKTVAEQVNYQIGAYLGQYLKEYLWARI